MGATQKAIWLACLGAMGIPVYAVNFGLAEILAGFGPLAAGGTAYSSYLYQLLPLSIFYLVALRIVFYPAAGKERSHSALIAVLVFAGLYRIFLVPAAPVLSTDMYRYIWDGRVQAHGINPYRYAPQDQALEALRDQAIYPRINRPPSPTIYPAGAQILFYVLNRAGIHTLPAFKTVLTVFDMGSVCVLILILLHLKLPVERVLAYAWHPLVIYELANNGHLDGVMVFFVLAALLFLLKGRTALSVSSLALAASLKLWPLALLPALANEKKLRNGLLLGLVFLGLYLPYLPAGKQILGFFPEYFKNPHESYNLGLKVYLLMIFPASHHLAITAVLSAALAAAAAAVWFVPKNAVSALWFAYMLTGLVFVLASGSLQPWYIVSIIPFLALFFSPAWIYFSLVICLSYLTFLTPDHTPPEWVRAVEYVPFFILLSLEYIAFFNPRRIWFPMASYKNFGIQGIYR
ncbi:MAG: DUF2029 domain-containing protein [Desulfobacteraceae bacterium]|nr:MAG: DUF2029 domain-containing protein [Desulfobacteraceae bacterium]